MIHVTSNEMMEEMNMKSNELLQDQDKQISIPDCNQDSTTPIDVDASVSCSFIHSFIDLLMLMVFIVVGARWREGQGEGCC